MIFGRQPTAVVAGVQAVLAMLIGFGVLKPIGLSTQTDLAVVMAVLNAGVAVYLAAATNETLLAPVVELFKAALTMAAIYGFHLTNAQTASVIVVITAVFGLWHQSKVSPLKVLTFQTVPQSSVLVMHPENARRTRKKKVA